MSLQRGDTKNITILTLSKLFNLVKSILLYEMADLFGFEAFGDVLRRELVNGDENSGEGNEENGEAHEEGLPVNAEEEEKARAFDHVSANDDVGEGVGVEEADDESEERANDESDAES